MIASVMILPIGCQSLTTEQCTLNFLSETLKELFRGSDRGGPAPTGPSPGRLRTGRLRAGASPGGAVASPGGAAASPGEATAPHGEATAPLGEATALPGEAPARNRPVRSRTGEVWGGWTPLVRPTSYLSLTSYL